MTSRSAIQRLATTTAITPAMEATTPADTDAASTGSSAKCSGGAIGSVKAINSA